MENNTVKSEQPRKHPQRIPLWRGTKGEDFFSLFGLIKFCVIIPRKHQLPCPRAFASTRRGATLL